MGDNMKIIAVIMVFNCGEVILDALKSIDGLVDEIHCFDSRWNSIPNEYGDHSSDDTKALIEKFAITSKSKIEYKELPSPLWESNARTLSIEDIKEGDWIFVIDSDERVIEWDNNIRFILEQSNELAYCISMDKSFFSVCRFFKKTKDMKYISSDKISSQNISYYDIMQKFKPITIDFLHDYTKRTRLSRASLYRQAPHP
jgi:glycosyltransferase involved in cell wall biosynthesis